MGGGGTSKKNFRRGLSHVVGSPNIYSIQMSGAWSSKNYPLIRVPKQRFILPYCNPTVSRSGERNLRAPHPLLHFLLHPLLVDKRVFKSILSLPFQH